MRFLIAPSRSRVKDVGEFSAAAMILGQTVLVVAMLLG
jgi:hypothetical protein